MADRARTRHEVQILESALSTIRSSAAVLPSGSGLEARARTRLLEAQLLVMKADYTEAGKAAAEAATLADEAGLLPLVATARLTQAWIWNWSGEGSVDDFHDGFGEPERLVDARERRRRPRRRATPASSTRPLSRARGRASCEPGARPPR